MNKIVVIECDRDMCVFDDHFETDLIPNMGIKMCIFCKYSKEVYSNES